MANAQKYTRGQVGHMLNHYSRQPGEDIRRGNEKINPELTHLNYNIAPPHTKKITKDGKETEVEISQSEFLNQRLSEVVMKVKRSNVNIMADWIVTLPENVPRERADEFFKHAYEFMCDRYGKENVISAWVHMDETTPHMHFAFVPVVTDKDGTKRLCAKECISKNDLDRFHPELQKYMEDKLSQPVGIMNGATAGGNQTIAELKLQTALQELANVKAQAADLIEKARPTIEATTAIMQTVTAAFKELDESLKAKKWFGDNDKAKFKALLADVETIKTAAEDTKAAVEQLAASSEAIGTAVENVLKEELEKQNKALQKRIQRTENKIKKKEKALEAKEQALDEKEKALDAKINEGVKAKIKEYEEPIRRHAAQLDSENKRKAAELSRKKQEIAAADKKLKEQQRQQQQLNIQAFFMQQTFLQQAQRNQETWQQNFEEMINYERTDD